MMKMIMHKQALLTRAEAFAPLAQTILSPDFDNIWVIAHCRPDEDCTGSSHGLAYMLKKLGKNAAVYCADAFEAKYDSILSPLNLPNRDNFAPCHFIAVDIASTELLGKNFPYTDSIDMVFDHHLKNTVEAKQKLVISDAAACGEIILTLGLVLHIEMDAPLAHCLYTAIAGDTGCFRFSNTTHLTHLAAAYLYSYSDPESFARLNRIYFEEKTKSRLRVEGYVLTHTGYYKDGKIGFVGLTKEEKDALTSRESDFDQLANLAKQCSDTEVGIVLHTLADGSHKLSARSNSYFDCASFCARLGGGGHFKAAGSTLWGEFSFLKNQIIDTAVELMEKYQRDGIA